MRVEAAPADAISALHGRRDDFVLIGGVAHGLMLRLPEAMTVGFDALTTMDIDLATRIERPLPGDELRCSLLARGFDEELAGAAEPANIRYRWRSTVYYVQVLAPRVGSGRSSGGRPLRIGGLVAERLPHMRVLLANPLEASIDATGEPQRIRIANPVAFMVQKFLIARDRWRSSPETAGKDLLYVHDTAQAFPPSGHVFERFASGTWNGLSAAERRSLERWADELANGPTDSCREAAHIAESTRRAVMPGAREIAEVCLEVARRVREAAEE